MPSTKFPGPNYNRLIENDAQIVKVPMDTFGWGSRQSLFGQLRGDPRSNNPSQPSAPEMTIKHVMDS